MKKILRFVISGLLISSILITAHYPTAAAGTAAAGNIMVDSTKIKFTIPTSDTSLFAPADMIYTALGAVCKTDKKRGSVKITYGLKTFEIFENLYDFKIKDKMIIMGVPTYFKGNQLMVPLRAIAESVGGGVRWDGKLKVWQVYSRDTLEAMVDILGDGTKLKDKLAAYEDYFKDEKYIFWSALRDGASIYRSDLEGKHQERLLDAATKVIGIDKSYIYYINFSEKNHLYRINKDGTKPKLLDSGSVFNAVLDGNIIRYYSLNGGLSYCSVTTEGKDKKNLEGDITVINGDWIIGEDTSINGKSILLKGNLIVTAGYTLTLENSNLVFDTGRETDAAATQRRLRVENSGLVLKDSTIISTRQDNGIDFTVKSSKLEVIGCKTSNINTNINVDQCKDVIIRGNTHIDDSHSGYINDTSENTLCENNIVISKEKNPWITFFGGTNTIIRNNVCVDQGECFFLQYGRNGEVTGNLFLGDSYWLGLSLRHDAGNSVYDNNFLQYNYDNGYRITECQFSNAINSDTLDSTTTYTRNVVNNAIYGLQMNNMSNCVYDSNHFWSQLFDRFGNRSTIAAVNMQYAHHNEIINNTFDSWNGGAGLEAFYCTENRIEGNTFTGYRYGIELWGKSDNNIISGNKLEDCDSSILINASEDNTVQNNALISTKSYLINVYNNGDNNWNSNYYSDWKSSDPRKLQGVGKDGSPLIKKPSVIKAKVIYQPVIFDMERQRSNYFQMESDGVIDSSRLWKDITVDYVGHDFKILPGVTLSMENVTLNSPSMYNSEPEIYVKKDAVLIMKNCKIICDPFRMPLHFQIEEGGSIIAENCTFESVHGIEMFGAKGSFKNCTFKDCCGAIYYGGCESMEIVNCKIINSFTGILTNDTGGSKISGNTLTNVTLEFPEPVMKPVSGK